MRKQEKSGSTATERGKAAQLAQLQARFVLASGEEIAYELAQGMLALAGEKAVPFLLEQTKRGGFLAEAAIGALHDSTEAAGKAVVLALAADPNNQQLARALPPDLPKPLTRRLIDLLPDVTDPSALRYIVHRVAEATPESIPRLRELQRQTADTLLSIGVQTGLASAGDSPALEDIQRQLPEARDLALLLMLSCRPLVESEQGLQALRSMLKSNAGDRAYVPHYIAGLGLTALAQEAAEAFVGAEDEHAAYAAVEALPVAWQHLTGPQLEAMTARACDLSQLEAQRTGKPRDLAARVEAWSARLDRAWILCAQAQMGSARLFVPIIRAAAQAVVLLTPHLLQEAVEPAVMAACSHLLWIQRRSVGPVWEIDRVLASALQAELAGWITTEMLCVLGPTPTDLAGERLVAELAAECLVGAELAVRMVTLEEPQREAQHAYALVVRNALRRVRLLRRLGYHASSLVELVRALKASRERETAALVAVEEQSGVDATPGWQVALDQRTLVLEEPAQTVGRFLRRQSRGQQSDPRLECVVSLHAEQLLQTDLCALLGVAPQSDHVLEQLVGLLSSGSALVRAAAETALARHPQTASEVWRHLRRQTDPSVQARLLEVLRCLGCPRSLGFARQALEAEDELLQAAAVRYVGQFGEFADLVPHANTLQSSSELVRLTGIQAGADLLAGTPAQAVAFLSGRLDDLSPAQSRLAAQLLLPYPRAVVMEVLTKRAASDDALVRVRAKRLLDDVTQGWVGRRVFSQGNVAAPVADDDVLGQSLMLFGDAPWQWGLPGFTVAETPRRDAYLHLFRKDDELAKHWDHWALTGASPVDLLPCLQAIAARGEADAEAALALGLDIIGIGAGLHVGAFADYHDLPWDEPTDCRIEAVLGTVFKQCTPAVVDMLQTPNASRNTMFSEILGTSIREEMPGHVFCLAYGELLKKALFIEFLGDEADAPPDDGTAFRKHVVQEWDLLKPHDDWYYGFWVWPRLTLADMGRYCSDRKARKRYRQEVASYLGYLATSIPTLSERVKEARQALTIAFGSRLREGARSIIKQQQSRTQGGRHPDWAALEEHLHGILVWRFRQAIGDFDVHWLGPHPLFPLGTLHMAWEQMRKWEDDRSVLFPERHLSLANLVERKVVDLIREELVEQAETLDVVSFEDLGAEDDEAWEPGDTREDAWEAEEILAERIEEGEAAKSADEALAPRRALQLASPPREIDIDGQLVKCLDIEQAARLLGRHPDTLRHAERAGKIRFVRDGKYRYLPVDDLERVRIVLRRTSEWAEKLGVSDQTVRNRMKEIPEGTDPIERERLLLESKGNRRRRRADVGRKPT